MDGRPVTRDDGGGRPAIDHPRRHRREVRVRELLRFGGRHQERERLAPIIKERCVAWCVAFATHEEIDTVNDELYALFGVIVYVFIFTRSAISVLNSSSVI